jgi:hypothetical protein
MYFLAISLLALCLCSFWSPLLVMSLLFLLCVSRFFNQIVLPWNENRKNLTTLCDPIHNLFKARSYGSYVVALLSFLNILPVIKYALVCSFHEVILHNITFSFILLLKAMTLFLCPLNVPHGSFPINDYFMTHLIGRNFQCDMFFSGHIAYATLTSVLFLPLWLGVIDIFLLCFFLLLTKTHYTIDVVVAPLFTFGALTLADKLLHLLG